MKKLTWGIANFLINFKEVILLNEVWKDIQGYEGEYQVSNTGRVRSIKSNLILKQQTDNYGYYKVILYKKSKGEVIRVHRLVAQTFIPNPNNFNIVNHIDENPKNNNIGNLEWCTQKHNINHGTAQARRRLTRIKSLVAVDIITGEKRQFESGREAINNKFYYRFILMCLKGEKESYKGYKWYYCDDYKNIIGV